jgi:hypothetical protein
MKAQCPKCKKEIIMKYTKVFDKIVDDRDMEKIDNHIKKCLGGKKGNDN